MIRGLDGLRFIAFLLIFLCHAGYVALGWTGVQLFFVLSGYLITGILIEMRHYASKDYFLKFYGRRFLRIFPLYYFYLIVVLIVVLFLTKFLSYGYINKLTLFLDQFPYAITYTFNFFHASSCYKQTQLVSHLWSLSLEEQFYIVWPVLIFITDPKKYKRLFFLVIFSGPLFRLILFLIGHYKLLPGLNPDTHIAIYVLPFSHFDAFAFGALVTQVKIRNPMVQFAILSIIIPVLGLVTEYLAVGYAGYNYLGYSMGLSDSFKYLWGYSLINYYFALLIYLVVNQNFASFLDFKPVKYMGKISYGLYVYHYAVLFYTGGLMRKLTGVQFPDVVTSLCALLLTILISHLSYQYFENPITKLKDRFFPR